MPRSPGSSVRACLTIIRLGSTIPSARAGHPAAISRNSKSSVSVERRRPSGRSAFARASHESATRRSWSNSASRSASSRTSSPAWSPSARLDVVTRSTRASPVASTITRTTSGNSPSSLSAFVTLVSPSCTFTTISYAARSIRADGQCGDAVVHFEVVVEPRVHEHRHGTTAVIDVLPVERSSNAVALQYELHVRRMARSIVRSRSSASGRIVGSRNPVFES